jgi:hypothetical protein
MPSVTGAHHMAMTVAQWATAGVAPPSAPRLELVDPSATDPVARDSLRQRSRGHPVPARGGAHRARRRPAQHGTARRPGAGTAVPAVRADDPALRRPARRAVPEVRRLPGPFEAATGRAVRDGFLLPEDAELLEAAATASPPVDP